MRLSIAAPRLGNSPDSPRPSLGGTARNFANFREKAGDLRRHWHNLQLALTDRRVWK
jgi:hypothetical protein